MTALKTEVGAHSEAVAVPFAPSATIPQTDVQRAIEAVAGLVGGPYQPLDADLTAIAALTTTSYGRALLELANGAALAALVDSSFLTPAEGNAAYQPLDADLTAIAAVTTAAYGRGLLALANATALAAEVDSFFLTPAEGNAAYQPLDSDLTAIAALTTTSYGRALLALANVAALRGAVGIPTTTVDNTLPRYDGTAGALQTSGVVVDDSNNVSGVISLALGTNGFHDLPEAAAPSTPAADHIRLYAKDNGSGISKLYTKDSTGAETEIGAGATAFSQVGQKFTASGTYTRTAGCRSVDVMVLAGGGGGGGAKGAVGQISIGDCGGGAGQSFRHIDFVQRTITGATQANPCVITSNGHGFQNSDVVQINNVVGMTNLNGNTYTVAGATTNTFQLSGINSTGYGAYSSGGTIDFVSCPVTVGAGGTAGAATPTSGGTGGTSSFGGYCSATGGNGGGTLAAGTTDAVTAGWGGGSGTGGDINITGNWSTRSIRVSGTVAYRIGMGADSPYGAGGPTSFTGFAGGGYGAGGGGAYEVNAAVGGAGGAGAPGLVLVTENIYS
ncbi:MAG: ubiquitin-activating E1 FCCH domain-containing protein [Hyphomicrobiaceae bacterium]|nr:ubiquitin-activating E1 FCCH domain-containing protein [Hyphomicrobiaceae bacterium]